MDFILRPPYWIQGETDIFMNNIPNCSLSDYENIQPKDLCFSIKSFEIAIPSKVDPSVQETILKKLQEQNSFIDSSSRIISLDPGETTFLTGYDYKGKLIKLGTRIYTCFDFTHQQLLSFYDQALSYLEENYDVIITTPYLGFANWKHDYFKNRIIERKKTILFICNESYTSMTCSTCGYCNKRDTKGTLTCDYCHVIYDRDFNGAKNILLRFLTTKKTEEEYAKAKSIITDYYVVEKKKRKLTTTQSKKVVKKPKRDSIVIPIDRIVDPSVDRFKNLVINFGK